MYEYFKCAVIQDKSGFYLFMYYYPLDKHSWWFTLFTYRSLVNPEGSNSRYTGSFLTVHRDEIPGCCMFNI